MSPKDGEANARQRASKARWTGTGIERNEAMQARITATALAAGLSFAMVLGTQPALAQLDNRPYQFRGGASVGMSEAGRQAILREELFGERPSNLVRGPQGLLELREGPGDSAIVSERGGATIPGFRGRSLFNRGLGQEVGVFNAFFGPRRSSASSGGAFYGAGFGTRASIAAWTDLVSDGGPTGAIPASHSPVDGWTSQVFIYFAP